MGQGIPQRGNILGKEAETHARVAEARMVGEGQPGQHVCPSSGWGSCGRGSSSIEL